MNRLWGLAIGILSIAHVAVAENQPVPPVAQSKPFTVVTHDDSRQDNYHWLRDTTRKNKAVLDYLNAENQYTAAVGKAWQPLTRQLYKEMSARQAQDNYAQPWQNHGYTYQSRFPQGADYPLLMRKQGDGEWQPVVDANQRSQGHAYYAISRYAVSEDNRYLAIAEDTRGEGQNQIAILDMQQQRWLPETLAQTSGDMVFSRDGSAIFYVLNHPQTLTPYRVMQHVLGSDTADRQVYQEADDSLYTGISRSSSGEYLIITLSGNDTSEARVLSLSVPQAEPKTIRARVKGQEYYVDHNNGQFYARSNLWDKNFGLYAFGYPEEKWHTVVAPQQDRELENFFLFDRWLVIARRSDGQTHFAKLTLADGKWQDLTFPDNSYMARPGSNGDAAATTFNYIYSSLDKPLGYYQWDLNDGQQRLVHQKQVPGVDLSLYRSEFVNLPARDGESIPVSLVYRKDLFRKGENPLLAYGYGAYGISLDAAFSAPRVSLLDRGFVFALVHVRGGGEKGVNWYLNGKKEHKPNSFNDFIDASRGLVKQGYGSPERLYGMGGSAGGLLLAAAVNQAPDLFKAVVLQVPFVDVLNSMLDKTLPLTQQEYEEWGNPNDPLAYRQIKAWSPYDNLSPRAYPNMLVTSGLYDSRVPYWEAAKYVARLRTVNRNPASKILLTTNMQAGHGGHAGRYSRLEDSAQAFSFLIHLDNKNSQTPGAPR